MPHPILFCNVGWMERYEGLARDDKIVGGGQYVRINKRGFEVCNFASVKGRMLGFVQVPGTHMHIEKLGANLTDKSLSGVDVVFTARRPGPEGKSVIVGWYRNATVYRSQQAVPRFATQHRKNDVEWFRLEARKRDSCLLPGDERTIRVPRGRNGMGTANVWFAEHASPPWLRKVRRLLNGESLSAGRARLRLPHSRDPERSAHVELAAIRAATKHYKSLGYSVKSVERENKGWDLEVERDDLLLHVEVKGLFGNGNVVELTPNEYREFSGRGRFEYRVCIVQSALDHPLLRIYRFAGSRNAWVSESDGSLLRPEEMVAAAIRIVA